MKHLSRVEIEQALRAAGNAHHEYEQTVLNGVHDEQWAGWYAAYVLGRLGDFATPGELTRWLAGVSADRDWFVAAAAFVEERRQDKID